MCETQLNSILATHSLPGARLGSQLKTRAPRGLTSSHTPPLPAPPPPAQSTDQNPRPQQHPLTEEDIQSEAAASYEPRDTMRPRMRRPPTLSPRQPNHTTSQHDRLNPRYLISLSSDVRLLAHDLVDAQQYSGFMSHSQLDLFPDYVNIQAPQDLRCFNRHGSPKMSKNVG